MSCTCLAAVIERSAIVESPKGVAAGDGTRSLAGDAPPEDFVNTPPLYVSRIQECTVELTGRARSAH